MGIINNWTSTGEARISELFSLRPFDFESLNRLSAEQKVPDWIYWTFVAELFLIMFSVFRFFFCLPIFYKHPMFHRNFLALLVSMSLLWAIMQISRVVVCVAAILVDPEIQKNLSIILLKEPFMLAEKFRIWAAYTLLTSSAGLMCERIMATKRLGSYERITSPIIVTCLVLAAWGIGFFGTIIIFTSPLGATASLGILFTMIVFFGGGYIYIKKVNQYQLRMSMLNSSLYTLSQSYQLRENLRVIKIFRNFIAAFMGTISAVAILFAVGMWFQLIVSASNTYMYVLRAVTNFVCAIATDIVCLSAILGTYVWRECLKQQIRGLFEFRNTVAPTIETNKPLQNRDGRRLTFNVKEEQHIYFQQLNDAWA